MATSGSDGSIRGWFGLRCSSRVSQVRSAHEVEQRDEQAATVHLEVEQWCGGGEPSNMARAAEAGSGGMTASAVFASLVRA